MCDASGRHERLTNASGSGFGRTAVNCEQLVHSYGMPLYSGGLSASVCSKGAIRNLIRYPAGPEAPILRPRFWGRPVTAARAPPLGFRHGSTAAFQRVYGRCPGHCRQSIAYTYTHYHQKINRGPRRWTARCMLAGVCRVCVSARAGGACARSWSRARWALQRLWLLHASKLQRCSTKKPHVISLASPPAKLAWLLAACGGRV